MKSAKRILVTLRCEMCEREIDERLKGSVYLRPFDGCVFYSATCEHKHYATIAGRDRSEPTAIAVVEA